MRPSPLDIRKQEFNTRFRGYDPDEVNATLTVLAQQWDEMETELRRRDDRLTQLEVKLQHYERVEEALQQAIETARESSRQAMATAEAKAEQLRLEAHEEARGIKRDAETERLRLRQETQAIAARRKEIVARLRAFLMSEMEMLAHFEGEDPVGFIRLMPPGTGQLPAAPADGLGPYEPADDVSEDAPIDVYDADERAEDDAPLADVPLAPLDPTPAIDDEPMTFADDADEGIGMPGETAEADETLAYDESAAFEPAAEEPVVIVPDETYDLPPFSDDAPASDDAFVDETAVVEAVDVEAVEVEDLGGATDFGADFAAYAEPLDEAERTDETYAAESEDVLSDEPQAQVYAETPVEAEPSPGSPWGDAPPAPRPEERPAPRVVSLSDIFPGARTASEPPPDETAPDMPEPPSYAIYPDTWEMQPPAPEPTLWADETPVADAVPPVAWDAPPPVYNEVYEDVYVPQPGAWEPELPPPPAEPYAETPPAEASRYDAPEPFAFDAPSEPEAASSPSDTAFPPTGYAVSSEFAFDPGPADPSASIPSVWSDELLDRLMPLVGERVPPVETPYAPPPAPQVPASPVPESTSEPLPAPRTVTRSGYAVESLLGDLSEASAPPVVPPSPPQESPVASASGEEIERIRRLLSGLG